MKQKTRSLVNMLAMMKMKTEKPAIMQKKLLIRFKWKITAAINTDFKIYFIYYIHFYFKKIILALIFILC